MQQQIFLGPPPGALGRNQKVKYNLISFTKSISKILSQTLCAFSQMKDTKHIRRDFHSILLPEPCPRDGTLGHWGAQGVKKSFIFKHGHMAHQIEGGDEQNRLQVKLSS